MGFTPPVVQDGGGPREHALALALPSPQTLAVRERYRMPIETAIWRLDGGALQPIPLAQLDAEKRLEDAVAKDLSILGQDLLLIGRQVPTAQGKLIDILAIDPQGNLIVAELKRNRTPREVVAQVLDYASWVKDLSHEDVTALFADRNPGRQFETSFAEAFDADPPEEINQSHDLVVVCSELDSSTERIITYLAENYGVPINAVFFRYYKDGDRQYLTRTWLIPPDEVEEKRSKSSVKRTAEAWNGRDFYVSLGEGHHRAWDDCRRYGFISAGGGKWYTQTLRNLKVGHRIFVHIPQIGYVGVGEVTAQVVPATEFNVEVDGQRVPLLQAPKKATKMDEHVGDPDKVEQVVRVRWLRAVPMEEAYWEKGLFAKQHSACKLCSRFTIERLAAHFGLTE